MKINTRTKLGDVFSVKTEDNRIKYFQYIISDLTQLNSDVIRAFRKEYSSSANLDLKEIVNGEVEFYAHCVLKIGLKLGYWEKVGNISDVGRMDHILFRDSSDYGNPQVKVSQEWWVWKINEDQKRIGKLTGKYQKAEIGLVLNPDNIVCRMRTGRYMHIAYPE